MLHFLYVACIYILEQRVEEVAAIKAKFATKVPVRQNFV